MRPRSVCHLFCAFLQSAAHPLQAVQCEAMLTIHHRQGAYKSVQYSGLNDIYAQDLQCYFCNYNMANETLFMCHWRKAIQIKYLFKNKAVMYTNINNIIQTIYTLYKLYNISSLSLSYMLYSLYSVYIDGIILFIYIIYIYARIPMPQFGLLTLASQYELRTVSVLARVYTTHFG